MEAIEEAKEHWKALMKQGAHLINIQMSNIAAFGKWKIMLLIGLRKKNFVASDYFKGLVPMSKCSLYLKCFFLPVLEHSGNVDTYVYTSYTNLWQIQDYDL